MNSKATQYFRSDTSPLLSDRSAPLAWKALGDAMQQIADWLKNLGMSEYEQRFAEHRVDLSVLPDLTD